MTGMRNKTYIDCYDSLIESMEMARIYIIGIIYAIMFFNIPFVRDHAAAQVQIYKPKVGDTVKGWGDKYTPALQSIIADLLKSRQMIVNGKVVDNLNNTPVDTSESWSLTHKNSLTADQVDAILRDYGSPATGLGATISSYSESKNIDNAYWLYMYIRESTAGKNGVAAQTKSTGNIKCITGTCIDGFQAYGSWEEGAKAHIDLLAEYRDTYDKQDIISALDRWAPASENNQAKDCEIQQREGRELSYPCGLMINVAKWRQANQNVVNIQAQAVQFSNDTLQVHPIQSGANKPRRDGHIIQISYDMLVYDGFYAISCDAWGFQANCQHWGTDIHVDANAPVFTPVDCTYIMTGHYSDPSHAGDYFMCMTYDGFEYYSGHLKDAISLTPGDFVPAGTIVGYGCTCVSGPHTHIQLRDPAGNLTDPMKYYEDRR